MDFATRAIHHGQQVDPQTGAVVPPIHLASTYKQHAAGQWREFDYGRSGNPTRSLFQDVLANLEGGVGCLAYASGMAAIHAVTMLLRPGDHIVAGSDLYGGAYRLLFKICQPLGIETTLVNMTDTSQVSAAIKDNTRLIWGETIGNPQLSIIDLPEIAEIAKQHGVLFGVDNTFGTPALIRPLEMGVDIVMHSATKYIGGHSDLLGGTLAVADEDLLQRLYFVTNASGAVMDPTSAYNAARGLKTLDLRVRAQSHAALEIARWLHAHDSVQDVMYPGLQQHPQHALADRLFDGGFGGMISFTVKGDLQQTSAVCGTTRLFQLAVSLGAVESLIEQPATMSHASYDAADRAKFGVVDSLIRLSIGLESPADLKSDLQLAFDAAGIG
ncbi:MAG: PLP-dependent aspartate aminotransferase family protein [Planctomycetota bacterium]